mmetsp:Transcript_58346/g.177883  ORF Transcript_58346/g.177883 Transcript_58346/m.177883 type:complete len:217 (+) Transcript_58346:267-917(+)
MEALHVLRVLAHHKGAVGAFLDPVAEAGEVAHRLAAVDARGPVLDTLLVEVPVRDGGRAVRPLRLVPGVGEAVGSGDVDQGGVREHDGAGVELAGGRLGGQHVEVARALAQRAVLVERGEAPVQCHGQADHDAHHAQQAQYDLLVVPARVVVPDEPRGGRQQYRRHCPIGVVEAVRPSLPVRDQDEDHEHPGQQRELPHGVAGGGGAGLGKARRAH